MVMIMLCFAGMLIMFLFVIRSLGTLSQSLKETERRQQAVLTDIENTVMEIHFSMQRFEDPPGHGDTSAIPGLEGKTDLNALMDTLTRRDMPDTRPPGEEEIPAGPPAGLDLQGPGQNDLFSELNQTTPAKNGGQKPEQGLQIKLDDQ